MLSVCIIGAGFSGICAGIRLKSELNKICTITILDKNSDFGGVWLKNTYPGCACDVPSHLYSYSFEPNPKWSQSYCPQSEILEYLHKVAHKYKLRRNTKFNHIVRQLTWDNTTCKWKLVVENKESNLRREMLFDIVVNAQGRFVLPEVPEQFRTFEGPLIHSAKWDHTVDIQDKIVAVIGCGASAAQIIPVIANKVKRLLIYQRHASWVVPRLNFRFPEILKWVFENVPGVRWTYRSYLHWLFEMNVSGFRIGTLSNALAPLMAKFQLWRQVKNPIMRNQLTPDYEFGCKRVIPSSDFYSTFNRSNVTLITSRISEITETSLVTENGTQFHIDVIILATGFRVLDFGSGISVIGKNGCDILHMWKQDKPKAYLGIMNSNAPNFFFLLGPNSGTGYTSVLIQLENQVTFVINAIKEIVAHTSQAISVKSSAEDAYMTELQKKMKSTIYGSDKCGNCNSWYLNQNGDVTEIYPDTTSSYCKLTNKMELNHFEFF